MVELNQEIRERVYAGVLGKLIGVYLGRAVEGWSYRAIRERFGEIANFVHHEVGMPLIVPDDDLSGTFVFFRALEDHGYDPALSARQIGETWLNYIIEDKTILWWGGMSRSTEHTAWLRLRQGHAAPASGSIALNGRAMAEQIGAQIFADGWALANPGAPARAARLAREAARVSHDGIAVDCAEFLAVLEALAFEEADAGRLLEQGLGFVGNAMLRGLVSAVRDRCAAAGDWREVRDWIEREHGYHRYPGNCPMVTNHLSVLMALLLSGADFQRSLTIAASAGWDTDCNAGNVRLPERRAAGAGGAVGGGGPARAGRRPVVRGQRRRRRVRDRRRTGDAADPARRGRAARRGAAAAAAALRLRVPRRRAGLPGRPRAAPPAGGHRPAQRRQRAADLLRVAGARPLRAVARADLLRSRAERRARHQLLRGAGQPDPVRHADGAGAGGVRCRAAAELALFRPALSWRRLAGHRLRRGRRAAAGRQPAVLEGAALRRPADL